VFDEGGMVETIEQVPLGVVANISAWNYPYFVGANVFVPALAAGNAVLYKPSEYATLTGLEIGNLLHASGVPQDVFAVLVGGGRVGIELLKEPVDGVFFTGSYPTGKRIAEAVAGRLTKVQLELGGKDPTYVCEDVDVAAAAASLADGAMYNTGQSCCSVERIYVHERIHDAFVEAFVQEVQGFKVGEPADETTYIGPLTRSQQVKVLQMQVADAVAKGARLLAGGHALDRPGGHWFAPSVLVDVDHDMAVMREESFGPIIGIQRVGSDDEAVRLMNDTEYGLTAGVYTRDPARARRLLAQVNAGSVYWNCCDRVSPRLPWSGRCWRVCCKTRPPRTSTHWHGGRCRRTRNSPPARPTSTISTARWPPCRPRPRPTCTARSAPPSGPPARRRRFAGSTTTTCWRWGSGRCAPVHAACWWSAPWAPTRGPATSTAASRARPRRRCARCRCAR